MISNVQKKVQKQFISRFNKDCELSAFLGRGTSEVQIDPIVPVKAETCESDSPFPKEFIACFNKSVVDLRSKVSPVSEAISVFTVLGAPDNSPAFNIYGTANGTVSRPGGECAVVEDLITNNPVNRREAAVAGNRQKLAEFCHSFNEQEGNAQEEAECVAFYKDILENGGHICTF